MPSVFPFPTTKIISRRQLVIIGLEETDVEEYGSEDKSNDPKASNEAGPSSRTTEDLVGAQGETTAPLRCNVQLVSILLACQNLASILSSACDHPWRADFTHLCTSPMSTSECCHTHE